MNKDVGTTLTWFGEERDYKIGEYVGETIAGIKFDRDCVTCHGMEVEGALVVTLHDGRSFMLYDDGRSCCEERYMTCDDDLDAFIGSSILGVEVRDGGSSEDEYGNEHEQQFVIFKTSLGEFTIVTHNEHNGYYGGFWLKILAIEEATNDAQ